MTQSTSDPILFSDLAGDFENIEISENTNDVLSTANNRRLIKSIVWFFLSLFVIVFVIMLFYASLQTDPE